MRTRKPMNHRNRGFTLLELLVVIVIIGLLAGYVAPRYFSQVGKSEIQVAKAQIDAFEKALDAAAAGFTTGGTVFTTATPAVALPAPTSGTLEVWFKKPVSGATVSGQVQLDGCYVAGRGVSRVDFFLDSTPLNSDSNVGDGMSCVLDTTKFANGTHQLKAVAYNSSGAAYNEIINVNIQNATPTPTPTSSSALPAPAAGTTEIWWKAPTQWQMVVGTLSNDKCYVDGRGVTKVEFYLDGKLFATDTNVADGMSCTFDTNTVANGTHELKAVAYGPNGAVYNEPVSINV